MDTNLKTFAGPYDNGKTVDFGDAVFDASGGFASGLKFTSAIADIDVTAMKVIGGHDACIDVNNSASRVHVRVEEARPLGEFAVTTKGGSFDIAVKIDRLTAHGRVCDLITDDWSDQSHKATSGVIYDVRTDDGTPVTVIALKTKPSFVAGSGPYKFLFPWPWINPVWLGHPWGFAFDTVRRWGFFRKDSNNP